MHDEVSLRFLFQKQPHSLHTVFIWLGGLSVARSSRTGGNGEARSLMKTRAMETPGQAHDTWQSG